MENNLLQCPKLGLSNPRLHLSISANSRKLPLLAFTSRSKCTHIRRVEEIDGKEELNGLQEEK